MKLSEVIDLLEDTNIITADNIQKCLDILNADASNIVEAEKYIRLAVKEYDFDDKIKVLSILDNIKTQTFFEDMYGEFYKPMNKIVGPNPTKIDDMLTELKEKHKEWLGTKVLRASEEELGEYLISENPKIRKMAKHILEGNLEDKIYDIIIPPRRNPK